MKIEKKYYGSYEMLNNEFHFTASFHFILAPTITRQPSNTYAIKSGIAELICEATGDDPLKYKWYQDNARVSSTERRRVLSNGHLYVKRVLHKKRKGISDSGQYYCTVTDANGLTVKSRTINLSMGCKYCR